VREAAEEDVRRGGREMAERLKSMQVFKAHRLVYHSTLGWRVIKKKKEESMQAHTHYCYHYLLFMFLVWTCGGGGERWPSV